MIFNCMAYGSCNKCGNAFEECSCQTGPEVHFSQLRDSRPETKKYFKDKISKELLPFIEIAEKELADKFLDLNDPNLPMYKRNKVMGRAMELYLLNKTNGK